jgi:hypothetical protein
MEVFSDTKKKITDVIDSISVQRTIKIALAFFCLVLTASFAIESYLVDTIHNEAKWRLQHGCPIPVHVGDVLIDADLPMRVSNNATLSFIVGPSWKDIVPMLGNLVESEVEENHLQDRDCICAIGPDTPPPYKPCKCWASYGKREHVHPIVGRFYAAYRRTEMCVQREMVVDNAKSMLWILTSSNCSQFIREEIENLVGPLFFFHLFAIVLLFWMLIIPVTIVAIAVVWTLKHAFWFFAEYS